MLLFSSCIFNLFLPAWSLGLILRNWKLCVYVCWWDSLHFLWCAWPHPWGWDTVQSVTRSWDTTWQRSISSNIEILRSLSGTTAFGFECSNPCSHSAMFNCSLTAPCFRTVCSVVSLTIAWSWSLPPMASLISSADAPVINWHTSMTRMASYPLLVWQQYPKTLDHSSCRFVSIIVEQMVADSIGQQLCALDEVTGQVIYLHMNISLCKWAIHIHLPMVLKQWVMLWR